MEKLQQILTGDEQKRVRPRVSGSHPLSARRSGWAGEPSMGLGGLGFLLRFLLGSCDQEGTPANRKAVAGTVRRGSLYLHLVASSVIVGHKT
jgi:hypothetical protein